MKTGWGMALFLCIGLLAAILVGFRPDLSAAGKLGYDEDQEGLKDKIIVKFSFVVAENTPKGLAADHFAKLVREKTNGKIEIQLYPNGMLYTDDQEEVEAVRRNDVQMIAPASSNLTALLPAWLVLDLPFAFRDSQEVRAAFDGEIGRRLFATLESKNMKGLAFWESGFRQMMGKTGPLVRPGDFAGQTFRTLPSRVQERMFQRLGARALSLPFNDIYHNLETGQVQGVDNTMSNILTKRLYQVETYLTISNHSYLGYPVIVNRDFWQHLPESKKQVLTEALQETGRWMSDLSDSKDREALAAIRAQGHLQIHELTEAERAEWRTVLDPLYEEMKPVIGEELVSLVQQQRGASSPAR
ncbi:DctP family TRAP transporter solute-binding subunit [Paenibacillus sp. J31TS4]|uniref:DctP family TRAP transporter solute-binding subunit n=1 Tax=Paenibacillus sp. J31TS4 TaxID=2807195 RepID=UPI001BD04430|nr:DctP family TRAP transporter solute-binding subunit [Paenibacillus sp. J31TS4]